MAKFSPLLGVQTPYGLFVVDGTDQGPGESLFAFRAFDDFGTLQRAIAIAQREGRLTADLGAKTFLEVGANIGTTTVPAVSVIGFGRGIAAEPAPANLRLLRANLALNGLVESVTVLPVGVGSKVDTMMLYLGQENHGDHRLWRDRKLGLQPTQRGIDVCVVPLDAIISEPDEVGIVWVDTQGFEGFVLAGATALRNAGIPFVTEFWPYGMRAAGSWDLFVEFASSAVHLVDLKYSDAHNDVDRQLIEALANKYNGVDSYTDLLLWFA